MQIKYTDMELKARNINHARNLFDRAITLLPRVDAVSVLNWLFAASADNT